MRSVTTALLGLAALASAADNNTAAILTGDGAKDVSAKTWDEVISLPTNSSTAKFTGFDLAKGYPSTEQADWQLKIAVKSELPEDLTATVMSLSPPDGKTLDKVDDSWHLCVYAFNVKATSATRWGSGKKDSCNGLVAPECMKNLRSDAVGKYASGSCPDYSTVPACLRDLEEQTSLSLSLSGESIP